MRKLFLAFWVVGLSISASLSALPETLETCSDRLTRFSEFFNPEPFTILLPQNFRRRTKGGQAATGSVALQNLAAEMSWNAVERVTFEPYLEMWGGLEEFSFKPRSSKHRILDDYIEFRSYARETLADQAQTQFFKFYDNPNATWSYWWPYYNMRRSISLSREEHPIHPLSSAEESQTTNIAFDSSFYRGERWELERLRRLRYGIRKSLPVPIVWVLPVVTSKLGLLLRTDDFFRTWQSFDHSASLEKTEMCNEVCKTSEKILYPIRNIFKPEEIEEVSKLFGQTISARISYLFTRDEMLFDLVRNSSLAVSYSKAELIPGTPYLGTSVEVSVGDHSFRYVFIEN